MLYCKKQGEEATVMPNDSFSFISERLYALMDEKYKKFQCSLIPTVDPGRVLGVRVPELRKIAREFWSAGQTSEFMRTLPHKTYEEDNIHGFLIERITDFDKAICELDIFLPYVDNWATCDMVRPKILKKNYCALYRKASEWISSGRTYTVRYAVGVLMSFRRDDMDGTEDLELVSSIKSDEYYVQMMIAWFFSVALVKRYDDALKYLEERLLDKTVHNLAIKKAVESRRIPAEQKIYLKTLKRL